MGQTSYTDFLIFARTVQDLEGGVFLNLGSAVTGPEVFLKALSMARNVARQQRQIDEILRDTQQRRASEDVRAGVGGRHAVERFAEQAHSPHGSRQSDRSKLNY